MTILIIGFSATLMLLISVIQLAYEYRDLRNNLNLELDSVNIYVDSIASSVWNFDDQQIQLAVDGLQRLPNIERVSVISSDTGKQWQAGNTPSENNLTRHYDLRAGKVGQQHVIGRLSVVASVDSLYQQIANRALSILISNGLKSFFVALFILYLFRRIVTGRLEQLALKVRRLSSTLIPVGSNTLPAAQGLPAQLDELGSVDWALDTTARELQRASQDLQKSELRFRTLVEWSPESIWLIRDEKILYVNAAAVVMFGATVAQDLIGKSVLDLVHSDFYSVVKARMKALIEHGGAIPVMEQKFIKLDGTVIDVEVKSIATDFDGQPVIQSAIRDTTERNLAQAAQRWAALLYVNIQDSAVVTDPQGAILSINPAFTAISGYTEADILGQNMRRLQSGRQGHDFYVQMWQTITTTGRWKGEIWNRRKNGEIYLERLAIHAVYGPSGTVANYVSTASDLTQLQYADQMAHLAHHDALTSLPNRLLLMSRLQHALEVSKRQGSLGAVLFFDLDHFKAVNDTWGHPAGDDLLQQVTRRINTRMRDMDTLARLGGDEFVVILEGIDGPDSAATVATEIVQLLRQPFMLSGGQEAFIGGSVGIAMYPTDGDSAEMLLRRADAALYRAKTEGRNTYRFHVG